MAAAIGLTPVLPAGGPVMVASCAAVLALAVRPPRGPRGRGGRSMSGTTMFVYVPDVFAIRMFGGFGLARLIGESEQWKRLLTLLPLAIVASVVAVQVFTSGR
ncbi:MAG: hypothetical protein GY929_02015 [Actinomycetia bacterium]|nr:hypothetical protein [Actinomycetes bacterium]